MPELGEQAGASDRATIFEAVRCALAAVADNGPVIVLPMTSQWSDGATLALLAALGPTLDEIPMLVAAAYRSDGLPRDHMVRWLRNELRRGGRLEKLVLTPLDLAETEQLLAELLPGSPSPSLVRALHDRTEGVPFFVEELACALLISGRLLAGPRGFELGGNSEVPVPDTVRNAVLMSASQLSDHAHSAAEAAAVAGQAFDLQIVGELSTEAGLTELIRQGVIREDGGGRAFRHSLSWEAFYADEPWLRRRALHLRVAEALEARGPAQHGDSHALAGSARSGARAGGPHPRRAAGRGRVRVSRCTSAGRQALELWHGDEGAGGRIELLERYARCAELAGQLAEAVRAWRELTAIRSSHGESLAFAYAQRRLAAVHELSGEREAAFAARRVAVRELTANGRPADAAVERLAMANHRRIGANTVRRSSSPRRRARRPPGPSVRLRARAMGLEGVARAKRGDFEEGLQTVRTGLALALEHDLTAVAAELYQRLGMVLYDSADYPPRRGGTRYGSRTVPHRQ